MREEIKLLAHEAVQHLEGQKDTVSKVLLAYLRK